MKNKIALDKFKTLDYKKFKELFTEYKNHFGEKQVDDIVTESFFKIFCEKKNNRLTFWINIDDDKVGFVSLLLKKNINGNIDSAHISEIYIKEKYQRKKIGTHIINYLIEKLNARNIKEVTLQVDYSNIDVMRFWKKLGFIENKITMYKKLNKPN